MTTTRTLATALALSLVLPGSISASWASVRDIPEGIWIAVRVADDVKPKSHRMVKGHFESASEDSVTLRTRAKNQVVSIPRSDVQKIKVRLPLRSRKKGWIISGSTGVVMFGVVPDAGPGAASAWGEFPQLYLTIALIVTAGVTGLSVFVGRTKEIYPNRTFNRSKIQPRGEKKLTKPPRTSKTP